MHHFSYVSLLGSKATDNLVDDVAMADDPQEAAAYADALFDPMFDFFFPP